MTVNPKKVCWMEVTVPHGLFSQSSYRSNEFVFWEARPLCLRVSLVEQAVISFGFPPPPLGQSLPSVVECSCQKEPMQAVGGGRLRCFQSCVLNALSSVAEMVMAPWSPVCCRWGQRLRSNTACSVSRRAAKGNQALQAVRSPLILKREAEDIFSLFWLKGAWDPSFD